MTGVLLHPPFGTVGGTGRDASTTRGIPAWLWDRDAVTRRVQAKADPPPSPGFWQMLPDVFRACAALSVETDVPDVARARVALRDIAHLASLLDPPPPSGDDGLALPEPGDLFTAAPCFLALSSCAGDLADALDGYVPPENLACLVDDTRLALLAYVVTVRQHERREQQEGGATSTLSPLHTPA